MSDWKRFSVWIGVIAWCFFSLVFDVRAQDDPLELAANTIIIKKKALASAVAVGGGITKPTMLAKYESTWIDYNPPSKTLMDAVAVQTGDVIVVIASNENSSSTLGVTENGTASFVEQYLNVGDARIALWTYTATGNENLTVTVTLNETFNHFGGCAYHFRGSDGVGVKNQAPNTSGDPAVTLTGVSDNSAIVMIVSDWSATSGTQTEAAIAGATFAAMTGYPGDGAHYGVFGGYYDDCGAAGNKAIGQTDPNGLDWTIAGIEVKGH